MASKVIRNITKVFRSASGVLFGRKTAGTGRGEELTPADVRTLISVYSTSEVDAIIGGIDGLTSEDIDTLAEINAILTDADVASISYVDSGLSAKQATLVSGANIKTVNGTSLLGSGDITVELSGTGSVDNAVLRADGTGGATLQASAIVIDDLYTSSPNNTTNVVCLKPDGGTTNVGIAIVPKGDGPLLSQVPNGASSGGNTRGDNSVDLQRVRTAATQVCSGPRSVLAGGERNTIEYFSSVSVICGGYQNSITGFGFYSTIGGGYQNAVSAGYGTVSGGRGNSVTSLYGTVAGGVGATANRYGQFSHAAGSFASAGDAQFVLCVGHIKTTNTTPTTITLDGSTTRLTIPSGKILFCDVLVSGIKSDGSAAACYKRKVAIKNVGGTTSLVGSVETIGTDHEDNAGTDVTITADDTNDALDISVTGITGETWRWVAVVEGLEIAYGT